MVMTSNSLDINRVWSPILFGENGFGLASSFGLEIYVLLSRLASVPSLSTSRLNLALFVRGSPPTFLFPLWFTSEPP